MFSCTNVSNSIYIQAGSQIQIRCLHGHQIKLFNHDVRINTASV